MATRQQRPAREIPLTEWGAPENQGRVVTRGELLSVLRTYDEARQAADRDRALHRRLWRRLTNAPTEHRWTRF
jgi:hypothetical protein